MEEYRKSVDSQHAPQALIERTLERIREEENLAASEVILKEDGSALYNNGYNRRNLYRGFLLGAAGLAACLVIFVSMFVSRPRLSYNPVSDSMLRGGLPEGNREELTMEEYKAYLGVDLSEWLAEYECSSSKIYVSYEEEAQTISPSIQKDEGTFYLNVDEHVVILKLSKSGLDLPEELVTKEASVLNGIVVYAGEEAESGKLFAAYNIGEIQYCLICNDMSKRQFEHLLKQLLQEEE